MQMGGEPAILREVAMPKSPSTLAADDASRRPRVSPAVVDAAPEEGRGAIRSQVATAGLYTASSYVATALGPLKGFVLAAIFAPNDFSAFIALTTALGWFAYADLGIFDGQNRRIPTLRGAGRTEESQHVAAVAQGATYVLALVAVLIAAAVAAVQAAGGLGGSWEFTAALGAAVLAQQVAGFPNSLCYAQKRFRLQGGVRAATAIIDFALGVGAALVFGIAGVIVAVIIATIIEAVLFHVGFRARLVPAFDMRMSIDLARTGLPIQAIWFAQTNMVSVDKVVALAWLGRKSSRCTRSRARRQASPRSHHRRSRACSRRASTSGSAPGEMSCRASASSST